MLFIYNYNAKIFKRSGINSSIEETMPEFMGQGSSQEVL